MKIRKTVYFAVPAFFLLMLAVLVIFYILEARDHTGFTDAAIPMTAIALIWTFPVGILAVAISARGLKTNLKQKLYAWVSMVLVGVPWALLTYLFVCFSGWKGD